MTKDRAPPSDGGGTRLPGFGPTIVVPRPRAPKVRAPAATKARSEPTRIDAAEPRVGRLDAASDRRAPRAVFAKAPTAIAGIEPRRVAVDLAGLRAHAPGTRPAVLDRTLQILRSFVLDGIKDRDAVLWGHPLQETYRDLVSRGLALSRSDALMRTTGYLDRMTDILRSVDIGSISGTAPPPGFLDRLLNLPNGRIDTADAFDAARIEIEQLIVLMGSALQDLLVLKDAAEALSRDAERIAAEIEAAALAADVLSSKLRVERPRLAQLFLERAMSLTQSLAQIAADAPLREAQVEQPLRLVSLIQSVALVSVPGWLAGASALTAVRSRNRRPTPTEAGELAHGLRGILQRLAT